MLIRRAISLVATLALAALSSADSTIRNPLRSIQPVRNPSILTANHRVTAVSNFDVVFDVSGRRIRLSLEPNHDIFVEGAKVSYLDADGNVARQEPINRLAHKVYKGTAWVKRGNRWDNVGWARISIRRDGTDPLFEGVFTVDHDHHHVQLSSNYKKGKQESDPDVDLRDHEYMVLFRDSDISTLPEHTELRKRSGGDVTCASDSLHFNRDLDHPVYAGMSIKPRDDGWFSPVTNVFGKRQLDNPPGSGNGAGVNLLNSIGSTQGCPATRKVALVGVAADCTYRAEFASEEEARDNIIQQMSAASTLFENTFNISLGLANIIVMEPQCPTTEQRATPWNRACGGGVDIQQRLNLFSQWRGQQDDEFSHWTLLTTCNTDSAVGLAWLGQACTSGSQSNGNQGEAVAGANVVVRTSTEWQVIAHETGHTFGAVHDCTARACQDPDYVASQQCCPLSTGSCDAGEDFIMNPSTAQGITAFSPCSVGNICAAFGGNSVKSGCFTNNRGVVTVQGETCGNGIVEGDEECDCGGDEGCAGNQCCDPGTCRFRDNAVCDDSNEDCCRGCQFASSDVVCRPGVSSCDPEERCTGNSPYCPEDQTAPDGNDCGDGLKCASGQCTSRNEQCKSIMGSLTQGSNDTYACDNSNCMVSCASPAFGDTCYGLRQNFLDGTPCGAGGKCQNGRCNGSSVANEVKSWIDRHKTIVIAVAASVGGLLVLSIITCCWRSYKRRRRGKVYASNPAFVPPAPAGPYGGPVAAGARSDRRTSRRDGRRGHGHAGVPNHVPSPSGQAPLMRDVPMPPQPVYRERWG